MTAASPEVAPYPGARLLDFVANRMTMSSAYQPLLIRALIESGGRCSASELANVVLLADSFAVARARKILMRWPRKVLRDHGIATYDRMTGEFVLPVEFASEQERSSAIEACSAAIESWSRRESAKTASRFFGVIERAGGRCEACGVLGAIRPLDVDHIIPQARARRGKVRTATGDLVDVDDPRNLQALCIRCNRGKRDTSTVDFRLSTERITESLVQTLEKAGTIGLDVDAMLAGLSEIWATRASE